MKMVVVVLEFSKEGAVNWWWEYQPQRLSFHTPNKIKYKIKYNIHI